MRLRNLIIIIVIPLSFLSGLFVGLLWNLRKEVLVERKLDDLRSSISLLELSVLSFDSQEFGISCKILLSQLESVLEEVDKFISLLEEKKEGGEDISSVERKYMFEVVRHWILLEIIKERCRINYFTILYFHSPDKDPLQGHYLTLLKSTEPERIMVFPLRIDLKVPAIEILVHAYNITSIPAIVINMEEKHEGLFNLTQLREIACELDQGLQVCLE
jgi:hypothetical protein